MTQKPLLKQCWELSAEDFARYPIWQPVHNLDVDEPWYDETDEETFRPWTGSLPAEPADYSLVRTSFTLDDGTPLQGYACPYQQNSLADLGEIQPVVFLPDDTAVGFYLGMFEDPDREGQAFCQALGKSAEAIFPITYQIEPGLVTAEIPAGTIPGFLVLSQISEEYFSRVLRMMQS